MTNYIRVIPRDLFNEANLLKCYGQLYLCLENLPNCDARLVDVREGEPCGFDIRQDGSDGSLTIANVALVVGRRVCRLSRPLNSRRPYPLYAMPDDDTTLAVFTDDGRLTDEMTAYLTKGEPT